MPRRQQVEGKRGHDDRGTHEDASLAGRGRITHAQRAQEYTDLPAAGAKGLSLFASCREQAYKLRIMRWGEGGEGTETARRLGEEAKGHCPREGTGALPWNR